MKAPLSTIPIQ